MEASTQISKEGLGAMQYVTGSKSLQEAPERVMYEAVMVNPKLQQKPQDVTDARNGNIYQGKSQAASRASPSEVVIFCLSTCGQVTMD
jgi:hypothetical protein